MSQTLPEPGPEARVRTMQICLGAQAVALLTFFIVALFLRSQGQVGPPAEVPVVSYAMLLFTATVCLTAAFVPGISLAAGRRRIAEEESAQAAKPGEREGEASVRWYGLRQTTLIMRTSMLEGAAFGLLAAYLVEGQLWTALLALVLLPVILLHFPTRASVDAWVERQRELAQQEQQGTF
jgi:hypothetical protein